MPLALIISAPFVFVLIFYPVMRRLAIRNILRRPRESALVILGSLLGTAILTGSFVVGDTLESSMRRVAHTQLGPVDEIVSAPDAAAAAEVFRRVSALDSPRIDGVLQIDVATASVGTITEPRRAAPRVQLVEVDFAKAREFGGDPGATGISGDGPGPGRVVVTKSLAEDLGVGAGDTVEAFAFGKSVKLTIDRVIEAKGVAGFSLGFGGRPLNAFVNAGTISGLGGDEAGGGGFGGFGFGGGGFGGNSGLGSTVPQRVVAVSNTGGVEAGAALTDGVIDDLEKALDGMQAPVRAVKADVLDNAETAGRSFSQIFTAMGSFGVIAGILLLVNIFVMLAEERRSELGMLRAVGMRRAWLVAAFSTEGWLYAVVAAALGSALGVILGNVVATLASRLFSSFPGSFEVSLAFAAKPSSIQRGFALGLLIAVVTVTITSIRTSRFNVIHAIRDIQEQESHRRSTAGLVGGLALVAVGALWTLSALARQQAIGMMLAPLLVVAGAASLSGRVTSRRVAVSAGALLGIVWGVLSVRFFRGAGSGNAGIVLFILQGVVLTASAVVLVSQNQEIVGSSLRKISGGNRALGVRLGLAYPLARRFRTGMTLAMYTLVVFTLTFITVFAHIAFKQIDRFAQSAVGGFDVIVTSNPTNPISAQEIAARPEVEGVAALQATFGQFTIGESTQADGSIITGYDEGFVSLGPPELEDRGSYASDDEAYRAVLADPALIIVPEFFPQSRGGFGRGGGGGGGSSQSRTEGEGGRRRQGGNFGPPERRVAVGDTLTMTSPFSGETRKVRIVALAGNGFGTQGALYSAAATKSFAGPAVFPAVMYVSAKDGVDPDKLAAELSGAHVEKGAQATAMATQLAAAQSTFIGFMGLMRGYLGLGLLVGIAGLGVVMVRAVRERRRQIGVLRALGFDSSTVRRAFVIESGFVALEGVLMGVALALVTVYSVVALGEGFGDDGGFRFSVPVVSIVLLVLGTLVASLLATAAPSQAASKIRPAVALRITD